VNQLYAGIVDVTEYGVRAKRGDSTPRLRALSAQMAFGKGATGSRFQVSLECDRSSLVGELHDDIDLPWPPTRGVETAAGIVRLEPSAPITGDARVVAVRVNATLEHVDAAPRHPHPLRDCSSGSGRIV
jgi:hypothetical protein